MTIKVSNMYPKTFTTLLDKIREAKVAFDEPKRALILFIEGTEATLKKKAWIGGA